MHKDEVKLVPLKEVFSEWLCPVSPDTGRGLVLGMRRDGGLVLEQLNKVNQSQFIQLIFVGKIKKPTLRVGFLNACLAKICPADPEKIKIPVLSRLQMERISEEFELVRKLERKALSLNVDIDLKIAKVL